MADRSRFGANRYPRCARCFSVLLSDGSCAQCAKDSEKEAKLEVEQKPAPSPLFRIAISVAGLGYDQRVFFARVKTMEEAMSIATLIEGMIKPARSDVRVRPVTEVEDGAVSLEEVILWALGKDRP